MERDNPVLIQDPPGQTARSKLPLVLIHDGGGTCFGYWCLNELDRHLYGIFNPRYESGQRWEGGIPEVARAYVDLLRRVFPEMGRRFILGGWSFGGMVALEMARLLADDKTVRVAGLILVDSPFSIRPSALKGSARVVAHKHKFNQWTSQETKEKVLRCFANAGEMVSAWTPPSWADDPAAGGPPPAVLIRAEDPVVGGGDVVVVDIHRQDPLLGWGGYRPGFFKRVINVPGHHFEMFDMEKIDMTSDKLSEACRTIDELASVS